MNFSSTSLTDKVAIVTGGGGTLGRVAACALAEAGADVVLVARTAAKCEETAEQVRQYGRRAWVVPTDITDAKAVQDMMERVTRDCGRVDILFNNAGIGSSRSFLDSSQEEWLKVIDVNLKGTFLVTKAVVPLMKSQLSGRIISMGSVASKVGLINRSAYSASKGALAQLTRALALELGQFGINVNALAPAAIVTDLNRELIRTQPHFYSAMLERIALGRLGEPADIAGPLVFLASGASAFVTGQILYVDGGYTAG